jgi:endoribonuclease Dicer
MYHNLTWHQLILHRQLEELLDSKIATASELSQIRRFIQRPKEEMWIHNKLPSPFGTKLCNLLESKFGDIEDLRSAFRFAWRASSELGRWCSDGIWKQVFSASVLPRLEGKSQEEMSRLQEANDIASTHILNDPDEPGELSPKVQLLRKKLAEHFQENPDTKCIVFTEMRYTALMLLELFNVLGVPRIRPGLLIGARSDDVTGANISFRQQFLALVKFRSGEINCLVRDAAANCAHFLTISSLLLRWLKKGLTLPTVT